MSDYCILVADAMRARIFTLEPSAFPTESTPRLVEQQMDFVNPDEAISGDEMWGNTRPGGTHSSSGAAHGYDDHRERHQEQNRIHFARQIAAQAIRHAIDHQAKSVVVVAEKHMLGLLAPSRGDILYDGMDIPPKSGVSLIEVAKDYSKLSPREIHQRLAEEQVIPPVKKPQA